MNQCDGCGGYNFTMLGILGNTAHLRCIACGLDCSVDVIELDDEYEDEAA